MVHNGEPANKRNNAPKHDEAQEHPKHDSGDLVGLELGCCGIHAGLRGSALLPRACLRKTPSVKWSLIQGRRKFWVGERVASRALEFGIWDWKCVWGE